MASQAKKIPLIGPAGSFVARIIRRAGRKLRGKDGSGRDFYTFKRQSLNAGDNVQTQQVLNLLNYTKTSGSIYNGQDFPAGYHSINVTGLKLQGQRNLEERYARIPVDFTGKTVIDMGCNQGGMLFAIADKIKSGTGVDFDSRVVNAANKIRSYSNNNHLEFYTFNMITEDLDLLRDFIPAEKVDVAFLLAVCCYLPNWRDVIDMTTKIASNLLFESNGTVEEQQEQMEYLKTRYSSVQLLSSDSDDRHVRNLYWCGHA
ncbi:MAG: class I SAM-dependent methyltransferase [Micavibrio sp.]|nr:class I SAM-dependent methyltransferase [Micavibrio sp.]